MNVEDVGLKLKWFFHKHILGFGYKSFEVLKTKGYLQLLMFFKKVLRIQRLKLKVFV